MGKIDIVGSHQEQMDAEPKSLTTLIYRTLRSDILCCRLAPGERLKISALQDRFKSSLSGVREALSRLSTEGLVAATDQRGFCVATVSLEDLQDVIRIRRMIEGLALRMAIEIASPVWEASVSSAYAELVRQDQRAGAKYGVDEAWVLAHETYHRSLVMGCNSPSLISICLQLSERLQRYRYLSSNTFPHRDGPSEHRSIFNAVLERDAEKAIRLLDQHFAQTAQVLTQEFTASGRQKSHRSIQREAAGNESDSQAVRGSSRAIGASIRGTRR